MRLIKPAFDVAGMSPAVNIETFLFDLPIKHQNVPTSKLSCQSIEPDRPFPVGSLV